MCDNARPVCGICNGLEITCHFNSVKPQWMDGSENQKAMAKLVKGEVKCSARRRRQRLAESVNKTRIQTSTHLRMRNSTDVGVPHQSENCKSISSGVVGSSECSHTATRDSASGVPPSLPVRSGSSSSCISTDMNAFKTSSTCNSSSHDSHPCFPPAPTLSALSSDAGDLGFVMTYFDYVFPLLFPCYTPRLLQGGRSWLLVLISRNKALYHATLSLAAYVASVMLENLTYGYDKFGEKVIRERLLTHTDMAFQTLQDDLKRVNGMHSKFPYVETVRAMSSVVQLLSVDMILANSESWMLHMEAGLVLFEQIIQQGASSDARHAWTDVLQQIGFPSWSKTPSTSRIWSPDQAAFRFFSAILVFVDIIASTVLERPPRLLAYHTHLLSSNIYPGEDAPLPLDDIAGCENWVFIAVGKVAALDTWKKEQQNAGTLSMTRLVSQAEDIEQSLRSGLASLDAGLGDPTKTNALDLLLLGRQEPVSANVRATVTRIWAHAAITYLAVVVSGWQSANSDLRSNVTHTLELFACLPSPSYIRAVVWPLCVTGCLADPSQESRLRHMVQATGPISAVGAVAKALVIMEKVWENRQTSRIEGWDLATRFKILNEVVLLA